MSAATHSHDLAEEVQEVIDAWRAGPAAGEGRFAWGARCAEELAEAVHAAVSGLDGDRSKLKAEATVLALKVFDDVVVPYDVPNVGAVVESWIEQTIRGAIPTLVSAAFDRIPETSPAAQ